MGTRVFDKLDTIRATLKSVALFANYPRAALDTLRAAAQLWHYGKGEIVVQAAEPLPGLMVLARGSLLIGRTWPNGKQMATGIMRPGWPFIVGAAWDGLGSPYTAHARMDSAVIQIPRAAFMALVRDDAERLRELVDHFVVQQRQDIEGLQVRLTGSVRCLMAKYLAYLSRPTHHMSFDDPAAADPAASDVTQEEMAAMLGITRQTVNKVMKQMERDGILVRQGNFIRVVNFRSLLAAMEEDEPIYPAWREQIIAWHEKLAASDAQYSKGAAPNPPTPLHR
jgi:CRP/FNR family transcriptional regulator, cyclic AMP receptor protein